MMKTLIVNGDNTYRIGEIPIPEIDDTSALVRVLACGICGTDKKILHGTFKGFNSYPCILGHEAVGEVIKVGKEVKYLKEGDYVIPPYIDNPPEGLTTIYGGFSEYAVIHDWKRMDELGIGRHTPAFTDYYQIQKTVPNDINPTSAVMMITLREVLAATRHFGFKAGESIVIFGAGAVGLSFAKMAKILGMGPVILTDVLSEKEADAELVGADLFINNREEDIAEVVRKICPNGVDYVLDAVGVNAIINTAMHLVANCGQILVYGISPTSGMNINWENAPYNWSLKFFQYPEKEEEAAAHEQLVSWVQQGIIDPQIFISHIFDFEHLEEGFALFLSGKPTKKIVITY